MCTTVISKLASHSALFPKFCSLPNSAGRKSDALTTERLRVKILCRLENVPPSCKSNLNVKKSASENSYCIRQKYFLFKILFNTEIK